MRDGEFRRQKSDCRHLSRDLRDGDDHGPEGWRCERSGEGDADSGDQRSAFAQLLADGLSREAGGTSWSRPLSREIFHPALFLGCITRTGETSSSLQINRCATVSQELDPPLPNEVW
jgi:hypothetical protein